MKKISQIIIFIIIYLINYSYALSLTDDEYILLKKNSPQFSRVDDTLKNAWKQTKELYSYKNIDMTELLNQQRNWVEKNRDIRANELIKKGLSREDAYITATMERTSELAKITYEISQTIISENNKSIQNNKNTINNNVINNKNFDNSQIGICLKKLYNNIDTDYKCVLFKLKRLFTEKEFEIIKITCKKVIDINANLTEYEDTTLREAYSSGHPLEYGLDKILNIAAQCNPLINDILKKY